MWPQREKKKALALTASADTVTVSTANRTDRDPNK